MKKTHRILTICGLLLICLAGWVSAVPVSKQSADQAVRGWLKRNLTPMETVISKNRGKVETVSDTEGCVLYYSVALKPQGFVVLSADDQVEPVVVFSATGCFDSSHDSPLKALLEQDVKSRLEKIYRKQMPAGHEKSRESNKWLVLFDAGAGIQAEDSGVIPLAGSASVSDVRVAPFLQSKWGQSEAAGGYCYNYYTPNHYVTGCVATAMAQIMRYYSWPTVGIGVHSFPIRVNGVEQSWPTLGGDGVGGAYSWLQMPYDPNAGITTTQRQAIGSLCYDAGLSVGMSYTAGSSSASTSNVPQSLKNTFGYANSIYGDNFSVSGDAGLDGMINSNLDAAMPVLLGISGTQGGHAVVVDGYGSTNGTRYHHLNMGWTGLYDAWYNLPAIDSSPAFNVLADCIYNIYPSGTGEIISGRITSLAGAPLDGVVVTAYQGVSAVKQATTNSRGVYALKNMPSNTLYRLSAVKAGYVFFDQLISTGLSEDWLSTSGNKWSIDFSATNPQPPAALSQTVDVNSLENKSIVLEALDDHLPNPPASVTFVITSLPTHGTLSVPGAGAIGAVPYTLAGYGNTVTYSPCQYYGGQDSFAFKANDGGTSPAGGDSTPAAVTINVDNQLYTLFAPDMSWVAGWPLETSFHDSRVEVIYLKNDVGEAKHITDLALAVYQIPGQTLSNWKIRMKHTTLSDFSATDNFDNFGWTQVYQNNQMISSTGWVWFHLQSPFAYDGSQNLMVDFSFNNNSYSTDGACYVSEVGTERVAMSYSDSTGGDPLTWTSIQFVATGIPNMMLIGAVPIDPIVGDFDLTCGVKLPDLAMLSAAWMSQLGQAHYNSTYDISTPKDNIVNLSDLLVFVGHWLQTYQP